MFVLCGVTIGVVLCARLFFLAFFHDESVPKLQRVVEAGTCEEGLLEILTWCTLESSRGKNGIHSCTGLLYKLFSNILILEFFSFLIGLRARTIGHLFLSLSHLGHNRMPIHLNYFRSIFFPFLIIHKIRSRHQNTTHNTIQHSTTKYSSSSPPIFQNVK